MKPANRKAVEVTGQRDGAEPDEMVEGCRSRPLDAGPYTLLWLNTLTSKHREGGRTVAVYALITTGVNAAGYRAILGIDMAGPEDGASWPAFLRDLVACACPASPR